MLSNSVKDWRHIPTGNYREEQTPSDTPGCQRTRFTDQEERNFCLAGNKNVIFNFGRVPFDQKFRLNFRNFRISNRTAFTTEGTWADSYRLEMPNGTGGFRNFQISRKKDNFQRWIEIFETNFRKLSVPFDFEPELPKSLVEWNAPLLSLEFSG